MGGIGRLPTSSDPRRPSPRLPGGDTARILSCNLVSAEKFGVLQGRRSLFRFADTCAVLQLDGLDAAALRRLRQRLRSRAHAQLSEQRFDMKLHSMERDVQPPCY